MSDKFQLKGLFEVANSHSVARYLNTHKYTDHRQDQSIDPIPTQVLYKIH